jgi:hypothetical protein
MQSLALERLCMVIKAHQQNKLQMVKVPTALTAMPMLSSTGTFSGKSLFQYYCY